MKKILFFFFLFILLPLTAEAYLGADFGEIDGEVIWMGWTIYESDSITSPNGGYSKIQGNTPWAYGRYQFDVRFDGMTAYLKRLLEKDSEVYNGFKEFVDHAGSNGISSYFSSHKQEFINLWKYYAGLDRDDFKEAQDEISYEVFYLPTKEALLSLGIDLDDFGPVIKGTVWSVAIRDGTLYADERGMQTYKALVNTYEEGISDLEYLERIMASQAAKHTGAETPRWSVNQKASAIAAMNSEYNATPSNPNRPSNPNSYGNVGGILGGALEDPFPNIFPSLNINKEDGCKKTFRNQFGELNELGQFFQDTFSIIKISVPVIVVILTTIEYIKAITLSSADTLKKSNQKVIKRFIIGLILFFLPYILDLLFYLFGLYDISNCGIY